MAAPPFSLPPLLGCDGGFAYTVGGLKDGGSTITVERRLEQLEKRNKRLTVALTMMAMVAITIQFSACGDDPAGPSANCDVSDVGALAGRDLSKCYLWPADLTGAKLEGADLASADRMLDHVAALVDLGDDPIGIVPVVCLECFAGPFLRRIVSRQILDHISPIV